LPREFPPPFGGIPKTLVPSAAALGPAFLKKFSNRLRIRKPRLPSLKAWITTQAAQRDKVLFAYFFFQEKV